MYNPLWCNAVRKAMIDKRIDGPKELAYALGFSRSHVSKTINGRIPASEELLNAISSFLGVCSPNH
jgi:transcriptional regulator with XRE-family HTH domain